MNRPFQCGALTIGWSGDEGPYHLLLTPIEIRQHSYNVSHRRAGESWSETCEERLYGQGAIEKRAKLYRKRGGIGQLGNQDTTNDRYGYQLSTMVRINIL